MTTSDYNDTAVKDICYNCGSPVAKQSYNYFRRLDYVTGGKVWSKVWSKGDTPVAFYYANRCRDHVRLIEIAVRTEYQGTGMGRKVLFDLLAPYEAERAVQAHVPHPYERGRSWLLAAPRGKDCGRERKRLRNGDNNHIIIQLWHIINHQDGLRR